MDTLKNINTYILNNTDKYFSRTKKIVYNQDKTVVYAFFLRHESIYAPCYALKFLNQAKKDLNLNFKIHTLYNLEDIIPANKPFWFIEGSFKDLCELETLVLQRIGTPFIAAYNSYLVCSMLKNVSFISMGARHCPTPEVANILDYGISVGSNKAKKEGAKGFIGSSIDSSTNFFNIPEGLGTMPHALIGYAGNTLKAAKLFRESWPSKNLTVLVDYLGQEITDSLEVCKHFQDLAKSGCLTLRVDTNGGRYLEGLNREKSLEIIKKHASFVKAESLTNIELNHAIGKGVSVAAVLALKIALIKAGFPSVKINVSSGFNIEKCTTFAKFKAPVDIIGTGSLLAEYTNKTFTTADIISYDNIPLVKKGREYLIDYWLEYQRMLK